MKSGENKTLVRRFYEYEEIVNTGIVDDIENLIAPEYTEVHDGKRHAVGIEGAKAHILGVRETYPDLSISIEKQIAEDEWVVTCITACTRYPSRNMDGYKANRQTSRFYRGKC